MRTIRSQARAQRSGTYGSTRELLAPHRDCRGALDHRPLVLVDVDDRVAVCRAAFPRGAEPVLRQFPGALPLRTSLVLRLARDLAISREGQLELGAGRGRCGERLAVKELR